MKPLVSILMPLYNSEAFVGQAVESALAQTYTDWELLIVDDGSTDGSRAVIDRFSDSRIRVFHQVNGGEAAARNTALDHARGEIISFLDADDLYLPDHLELTVGHLISHPDHDGVYTDGDHCTTDGRRLQSLSSRRRGPFEGDIFEPLVRAQDVFGPPVCVVIRREPVETHHLRLDPEIRLGTDWDFFVRLSQYVRFGYIDRKTCLYRIHTANLSTHTDLARRLASQTRCREKAIYLPKFETCSVETRAAVFYDLLVNGLSDRPERQAEVVGWPQFQHLPESEQARLLRLMAAGGLGGFAGELPDPAAAEQLYAEWLRRAVVLAPDDARARLLDRLYRLHPMLARLSLRLRRLGKPQERFKQPMSDIRIS